MLRPILTLEKEASELRYYTITIFLFIKRNKVIEFIKYY